MIQEMAGALGVSEAVVWGLLVLAAVQIAVQVYALVDLLRVGNVAGGRKWVWALVIVALSNLALGAILYFAIGRKSAPVPEDVSPPMPQGADRAKRAAETLYGSRGGEGTEE